MSDSDNDSNDESFPGDIKILPLTPALRSRFTLPKHNVFEDRHAENLAIVSNVEQQDFSAESQETAVQFLDVYGASITKLSIQFKLCRFGKLLDAINENCGAEVVALKFVDFTADEEKRKHNINKFGNFIQNLSEKFPNLQELVIEHRNNTKDLSYWNNIVQPMPSLKCVAFNGLSSQILVDFIQNNPQIESLSFGNEFIRRCCAKRFCTHPVKVKDKLPANCLEIFDGVLPQLKHLYLDVGLVHRKAPKSGSKVYLNKLKTLVFEKYVHKCWQPNLQLIAGDELQYLQVNTLNGVQSRIEALAEKLIPFVNLKELTINMFFDLTDELAYIEFYFPIWSLDALREFILSKPHLTKITIRKRAVDDNICLVGDNGGLFDKMWLKPFHELIEEDVGGDKWRACFDEHPYVIEIFKDNVN